jgi:site-specific recombinase XerD
MLDMTLEQGQQVFLKALAGNNFSSESIRAYNADITQFVDFLKSLRVDWNNPRKIERLDIVEFMNRLAGLQRTGTTRARKLASIRHFLKFLKENSVIAGNPAETITRARKEEKDPKRPKYRAAKQKNLQLVVKKMGDHGKIPSRRWSNEGIVPGFQDGGN